MRYSILGKTGLKVSALGFGCMRLPEKDGKIIRELSTPLLRAAVDLGVNFFDTAVFYCNGDSQAAVGEAMEGIRDKVVISTKNHDHTAKPEDWRKHLENSLRMLRTDYIDIYNHHGINWDTFVNHLDPDKDGLTKEMMKAKEEGLIRHIAFSFHDKPENMKKLIDTGYYESIICQYNLLDQANAESMQYAHEKGIGIIVMGPVGGGRLGFNNDSINSLTQGAAKTTPEAALRFVWAHPAVNIALSGMQDLAMLNDNVRIANESGPFTEEQLNNLNAMVTERKKKSGLYCSGCRYCTPKCPQNVPIPDLLEMLNQAYIFDIADSLKGNYKWMQVKATDCINCKACTSHCPQKIDIPSKMREVAFLLDEQAGKVKVGSSVDKCSTDGNISLNVNMHNITDSTDDFTIELKPSYGLSFEKVQSALANIAPFVQRKQIFNGQITPELTRGEYSIVVKSTKVGTLEQKRFFDIVRKEDEEDWTTGFWTHVQSRPSQFTKDGESADFHSFRFKVTYTDRDLILYIDVKDDFLFPSDEALHKTKIVDCVELFLDTREQTKVGSSKYEKSVYQIALYPGNPGITAPFYHVWQGGPVNIELKSERIALGYRLHAKIPFSELGFESTKPSKIGFDITVNSADAEGNRIAQYAFSGGNDNWRDPSGFRETFLL